MITFDFKKWQKIWKQYGYEITILFSLLIILFGAIFQRGKKGTWNKGIFLPEKYSQIFTEKTDIEKERESHGETECRKVLETIFGKPFKKHRPDFLKNPITSTGTRSVNLELDCFNPELRLAVEYNGAQHYKYIPYFHRNYDCFKGQQYRDYIKKDLCQKNHITLITVPYTVKIHQIKGFLLEKLSYYGYNKWMI